MTNLGKSIYARMNQLLLDPNFPFPEEGYHGEYVISIAQEIIEKYQNSLVENNETNLEIIRKYGEE